MSHHYSGPDFGFPKGDARLDFTDLYAFPKPGDPGRSVLIVKVPVSLFSGLLQKAIRQGTMPIATP
jgi:hypothetical protein